MTIKHTSRTGKIYYLHSGPKKGGGVQHFFSTKSTGNLAACLPEGFEIYESVMGQVFLRRVQPKLIQEDEVDFIVNLLKNPRARCLYKVEIHHDILTIHESEAKSGLEVRFGLPLSRIEPESLAERFAYYQPVLRFILVDPERRHFAPERFCYLGSVDDWISIGPAESIQVLASKYLKHLGRDSFYKL